MSRIESDSEPTNYPLIERNNFVGLEQYLEGSKVQAEVPKNVRQRALDLYGLVADITNAFSGLVKVNAPSDKTIVFYETPKHLRGIFQRIQNRFGYVKADQERKELTEIGLAVRDIPVSQPFTTGKASAYTQFFAHENMDPVVKMYRQNPHDDYGHPPNGYVNMHLYQGLRLSPTHIDYTCINRPIIKNHDDYGIKAYSEHYFQSEVSYKITDEGLLVPNYLVVSISKRIENSMLDTKEPAKAVGLEPKIIGNSPELKLPYRFINNKYTLDKSRVIGNHKLLQLYPGLNSGGFIDNLKLTDKYALWLPYEASFADIMRIIKVTLSKS